MDFSDIERILELVRVHDLADSDDRADRGRVDVDLSDASQGEDGQTVTFPERTFSRVSIEILADSQSHTDDLTGVRREGRWIDPHVVGEQRRTAQCDQPDQPDAATTQ